MWKRVYKGSLLHYFINSIDTLCGKTFSSFTYIEPQDLMGYKRCKECDRLREEVNMMTKDLAQTIIEMTQENNT